MADYAGFGKRKREGRAARQAARHRLLDLHRGLRHRAARRRSARSAPASACGNPPRCASIRPASVEVLTGSHSHGQGHETTFAQLVSRAARHPDRATSRSCTATPTRCSSAWAPTARARARSACSAIVKALDKVEAKAKKVAAHLLEAAEGDIVFKDGKFTVAGTDKSAALRRRRAQRLYRRTSSPAHELEPGLKEGAFYDPTNFTFPAGCHICEVEVDPETGDDRDRRLGPRSTTSAP